MDMKHLGQTFLVVLALGAAGVACSSGKADDGGGDEGLGGSGGSEAGSGGSQSSTGGSESGSGSGGASADVQGFSITVNGEDFEVPFTEPGAATYDQVGVTQTQVAGIGTISGGNVFISILIPGTNAGIFSCAAGEDLPEVSFQKLDGSANLAGSTGEDGATCTIRVTRFDDQFVGTVTAHIENTTGEIDLSGTFDIPVDAE